ncbi:tetratricopeptide repeat protein [Deinococcus sp. KNUC1210]|nr:HD domain-containing phosphohydrolase [Deinococcus sp. KNUC1210]ULH14623.1 tetratricopeptide repeat protein [Deinococcus sp. KNUC1210]
MSQPPDPASGARLAALQAEVRRLLDEQSQQGVEAAQDYRALADLMDVLPERAISRFLLGQALMHASELRPAIDAAVSAAGLFAQLDDPVGEAEARTLAGRIHLSLGAFEEAEEQLRAAIALVGPLSQPPAQALHAVALNQLAGVQFNRGKAGEALLSLERAFQLNTLLDNLVEQANCLTNIGTIQNALGQYHAAIQTLGRAYEIYKTQLRNVRSEGFILNSLAWLHFSNQDYALAIDVAQAACAAAETSQDGVLIASTLLNLGTFCLEAGQYEAAGQHLMAALERSRAVEYRTGELSTFDSLGMLYQKTGELTQAKEAYLAALTLALELEDAQGELEARLHLGTVELTLGAWEDAQQQAGRGLALAVESQSPKEEAEAHRILAELAARQEDYRRAFEHSQEHLRIRNELFDIERDRQTRNLSIQFEVERARHDADVYRVKTESEQRARLLAEEQVRERTAELARTQHEVVTRLAMAGEYRDGTTGEHTRRVGRSAARIARALGWPADQAEMLGVAARLHDVGKIGIPDKVLLKSGKFSAEELEHMKTHTLIGARILSGGRSELLRLAEEIALTHHERWDGSGYPLGLRGEEIPVTGRIVALADVYDALTQERPYKRAWTPQEALAELRREAGSHFDPLITETALRVLLPPERQGGTDRPDHAGRRRRVAYPERLRAAPDRADPGSPAAGRTSPTDLTSEFQW